MVNWHVGDLWPLSLRSLNDVLEAPTEPVHLISDLEVSKDNGLISREATMDEVYGHCLSELFPDSGRIPDLTIADEAREQASKSCQSLEGSFFQETLAEVRVAMTPVTD